MDDRLDEFREMNNRDEKASWKERSESIHRTFPSIAELDWEKAFRVDPSLMGKLIGDILKVEAAEPGKPGKRPAVAQKGGEEQYRRLVGEDYTDLPFPKALKVLSRDMSVRGLAARTNISKSKIHQLMTGAAEPTVQDIEEIAKALHKQPEYFWEYRIAYICGMVHKHLNYSSEASILLLKRIKALMKHNKERGLV